MCHRPRPSKEYQKGASLVAALFFIVIVALFGILALRTINMGTISSSEQFRYTQGGYAALGARDLRILNILSNGAAGWDGTGSIEIGPCTVRQDAYGQASDKDIFGNNITIIRFKLRSMCKGEGPSIGRTWEAVIRK